MPAIFILKKETPKKHKFFIFLKSHYFIKGDSIDMNVGVFWETSVGFLKSILLQPFPKYSQSYANLSVKVGQNSTALKNRQVFLVFSIYVQLLELYKSFLEWPWSTMDVFSFKDIG